MPDREFMWANPMLGTITYAVDDPSTDGFWLETVQDLEPAMEANKRDLSNAGSSPRFGDGKIVASIPLVLLMQLQKQGVLGPNFAMLDEPRFRRWLNDPENRHFRTFPGNI